MRITGPIAAAIMAFCLAVSAAPVSLGEESYHKDGPKPEPGKNLAGGRDFRPGRTMPPMFSTLVTVPVMKDPTPESVHSTSPSNMNDVVMPPGWTGSLIPNVAIGSTSVVHEGTGKAEPGKATEDHRGSKLYATLSEQNDLVDKSVDGFKNKTGLNYNDVLVLLNKYTQFTHEEFLDILQRHHTSENFGTTHDDIIDDFKKLTQFTHDDLAEFLENHPEMRDQVIMEVKNMIDPFLDEHIIYAQLEELNTTDMAPQLEVVDATDMPLGPEEVDATNKALEKEVKTLGEALEEIKATDKALGIKEVDATDMALGKRLYFTHDSTEHLKDTVKYPGVVITEKQ